MARLGDNRLAVEPTITINGTTLDEAQARVVRTACEDFLMWLEDEEAAGASGFSNLTKGPLAETFQQYHERMREIADLLHAHIHAE